MNTMLAGIFGGYEVILIFAVALLLFGPKKLPELARGLGKGLREFKKASSEVTEEFQNAMDDKDPPSPPPAVSGDNSLKRLPPPSTVASEEYVHDHTPDHGHDHDHGQPHPHELTAPQEAGSPKA